MSRFNDMYSDPQSDMDGGNACISAELYTREEAANSLLAALTTPSNKGERNE